MPRTIEVLLENKPGALLRAAGLITAMGCNIDRLSVGPDPEHNGLSRMILVADLTPRQLDLVLRKMRSVIHVVHAEESRG
jgi:acetolactate synthase-1/3 small subunit